MIAKATRKPEFARRPLPAEGKTLLRGRRGGRRASLKKALWSEQKRLSETRPDVMLLNSRDFRWWYRDQVYLYQQKCERIWSEREREMLTFAMDHLREENARAEDERVLTELERMAS